MLHSHPQSAPRDGVAPVGRRIVRATSALMLIQVILRAFGLIEKIIMAKYLGTGEGAQAYSAARRITAPIMMLGDQVIMHSFLPPFVQRMRERGEHDAWRLASTCINLLGLLMGIIAVAGLFYTPVLLNLFVPKWVNDPGLAPMTIGLTRIMLVAMIFLAISSLTYCLLNSYKQFALPASSDLALKGIVLVMAVLFARQWGAYALAIGFVIGAAAKVVLQAAGLGRRMTQYRPVLDLKDISMRRFAWLALPLVIGWGFSSFRGAMETRFLAMIADHANVPAYDYAKQICDIPVTFFPYAFGIALFPFLADLAVAGEHTRLREMLLSATRMMVLIFIPLALGIILLRFPLLMSIYGSDKYTTISAHLTAAPLVVLAIGMLAGALEIIINQFYFALSDTMRPTFVGIALLPAYLAVGYYGVVLGWGAAAVASAYFLYRALKVVLLYGMIRKKLGTLQAGKMLALLGKIAVAILPLVLILLLAAHHLPHPEHAAGKMKKLMALLMLLPYLGAAGVGTAAYFFLLHRLHVDEVNLLLNKARGIIARKPLGV